MESKPYDIVLLPEIRITQEASKLSGKLQTLGSYFTLDNKTFFAHISIYMLELSDEGLEKVLTILPQIASQTSIIKSLPKEYHYESDYIDIEFKKTKELESLQEIIINHINPLRAGLREKDKERLENATGEERDNILEYGYRSIGKLFRPHLTFTRFKDNQQSIINTLPSMEIFNGNLPKLGIFEMGNNGTCIREVKFWALRV